MGYYKYFENKIKEIDNNLKTLEKIYNLSIQEYNEENKYLLEKITKLKMQKIEFLNKMVIIDENIYNINKKPEITKVTLDGYKGNWIISYKEEDKEYHIVYPYKQNELENKNKLYNIMEKKYGNTDLKKIDIGLYTILKTFDVNHKTRNARAYLNGIIKYDLVYNFSRINKSQVYNMKEKTKLIKEAYNQKKYKNAKIINPKINYLVPIILTLGFILGLTGSWINKKTYLNNKSVTKETIDTNNKSVTKETIDTNNKSIKNNSKNEKTSLEIGDNKTNCQYLTEKVKTEEDQVFDNNYYLHDEFNLESLNLINSTIKETKSVSTDKLKCNHYKIDLISIVKDNEILEIENADFIENKKIEDIAKLYKEKYDDNVEMYVNFNGYDKNDKKVYSQIGWTNASNIIKMKKTVNQSKIDQLKKYKYTVVINSLKNRPETTKSLVKTL